MNKILQGNCIDKLKELEANSVDAIVTDAPYGLSFMGKKWDYDVPSVEIWQEAIRVLKPGGYLLSFAGTRTQHRMACNIEDAGFEIRDMIAWVYGSGFPKSLNIGHKLEDFKGWGTALKPALEPITVARKPLSEKTVAENVLKWGTGGINIDGSRVEYKSHGGGRFPANFIHDGSDEVVELFPSPHSAGNKKKSNITAGKSIFGIGGIGARNPDTYGDSGSASRFFYCAKASKSERGSENKHPTVKPIKLMEYLVKLVSKEGAVVLDPFAGSGSTLIACKNLNRNYIGMELDPEYIKIAEARLSAIQPKLI